MKKAIGYRESPDGGTRHAHFQGDELPKDWKFIEAEAIPGPDPEMVKAGEIQRRLQAELSDLIITNPGSYLELAAVVAARKAELELELTSG